MTNEPKTQRQAIIYLVTNTVNDKRYVGWTKRTLNERMAEHRFDAKSDSGIAFHAAIRKYGWGKFRVEEICQTPAAEGPSAEQRYIQIYESHVSSGKGYNLTLGGEGHSGFSPTAVTKKQISTTLRARNLAPEQREQRRIQAAINWAKFNDSDDRTVLSKRMCRQMTDVYMSLSPEAKVARRVKIGQSVRDYHTKRQLEGKPARVPARYSDEMLLEIYRQRQAGGTVVDLAQRFDMPISVCYQVGLGTYGRLKLLLTNHNGGCLA